MTFSVCDMARMQFIFHSGSLREKYFRSQLTQEMNTFEHRQGQKHFKQIQFVEKIHLFYPFSKNIVTKQKVIGLNA